MLTETRPYCFRQNCDNGFLKTTWFTLVLEAVDVLDLRTFQVNERGSGSDQYPPWMMLALLIYCYAYGIFGSCRIQWATYRDVAVRQVVQFDQLARQTKRLRRLVFQQFRRSRTNAIFLPPTA